MLNEKSLGDWVENVDYEAKKHDQSPHDALCDILETSIDQPSNDECRQIMAAFDCNWD